MSIPAPTKQWTLTPLRGGSILAEVTLTGASQVAVLELFDLPIDTVHIYGTFNGQNVSLLGSNTDDTTATATPQALTHAEDNTKTFSAVAAEVLASLQDNPRYLFAQSNGAVTSVVVSIMMVDRKAK